MVEVTEADKLATKQHQQRFLTEGASETELLWQAFATHRIEAAKAERDRIVAWLRSDGPDRDNGGPCRHVEHSQGTCICNELADALESQP
ncbi:MAG: hypothetical protein IPM41_16120 [Sphingomonadales bacterium]|nr:hypothetical protein [Sphingomonadales bacterium]